MKVLMLSGDPRLFFYTNSPVADRMRDYGKEFGPVDILLFLYDGGYDIELSNETRVFTVSGRFMRFVFGFKKGIKLLRKNNYDVIVAQDIEYAFIVWLWSLFFGISWQMQIHTDIFSPYFAKESWKNKMRVILAKFLIPRANCVRVVSERIKNSLTAYGTQHIAVFPILVDIERIKNYPIKTDLHQKYSGKFIILMASRLTREKNISFAIDALSSLIRANKRIQLVIVGNGPEEKKLKLITKNCGLWTNIVFEPWTDDLTSYYKTCDLFLLTSNYEGYGMTLVEAAVAGSKIISSDVGIAPEILDGENIFKVGDKNDLIQKLKLALEGKIKSTKPIPVQTKEEYLRLYKESLEKCIKN